MDDSLTAYLQLVAERLRLARLHARLTQEATASRAGVTLRYYADVEAARRNVTLDTMLRIADAVDTPVGVLLDIDPEASRKRLALLLKADPQPLPLGRRKRLPHRR